MASNSSPASRRALGAIPASEPLHHGCVMSSPSHGCISFVSSSATSSSSSRDHVVVPSANPPAQLPGCCCFPRRDHLLVRFLSTLPPASRLRDG
ncbi:unnamed protein product [Linum trigynum]|uniref:Uncharacterized protein n=1 Tax=Linum trigynum TaxID=586398 RepID=A0AAV2FPV8_9ROSI